MRIAVLDDYQSAAAGAASWDRIAGADIDFVTEHLTGDELVARIADCEVVVAMRERTPVDDELLERLPRLRLLITTGMRNAAIDGAAAGRRGVTYCGTRSYPASTAELTWALIFALVRPVAADDAVVRAGGWQTTVGGDLAGQTLGLVGLGRLGAAVARVGQAFGMRVVAWSEHLTAGRAAEHGVESIGKHELFSIADVISLHLVLSDRSRSVVGEPELRAIRPQAYLVNSSRAALIDQVALRTAVEQEWLAGIALDVYDLEPLPAEHWLRRSRRTVLSPHMGYVSGNGYRTLYGDVVEDILAFQAGAPVRVLGA